MGRKGKKRKQASGGGAVLNTKKSNKNKIVQDDKSDIPEFKTANEKFVYLLKNQIGTDCEFVVGPKKKIVKAHQLVLTASSKVFEKMFSGQFKDKHSPINIVDADASNFQKFIVYLYSGEVEISNVTQAEAFFDLGNKYHITSLMEKSTNYIIKHIQVNNVLDILTFADLYAIEPMLDACKKELSTNTQKVINEQNFLKASMSAVKFLVRMPELSIPEAKLIDAIMSWSLEEIIRQEIYGDEFKEQQILVYDNFTPHIRFESLTPKEFVECEAIEKMLRPEIFFEILKHLVSPSSSPLPEGYTSGTRILMDTMEFCYYQKFTDFVLKPGKGEENYVLYPTKCLKIAGVTLSGIFSSSKRDNYEDFIDVHIQGGELDCHGTFTGFSKFNAFIKIYFDEPVLLKKHVKYHIILKMVGPNVYMAGQVLNKAFKHSKIYLLRDEDSVTTLNLNSTAFPLPKREYTRLFGLICEKKRQFLQ